MWSQEVPALSRRWLLIVLRERLNLLFSVLQPAVWLVFFAGALGGAVDTRVVGTDDYIAFAVPGIIAFTVVGNGVTAAMPLLFDKESGYLDKPLSMPIRRSSVIVSRFVFQVGMNSAQVLVILLVAHLLGVRPAAGPLGVPTILVVSALLTLALTAAGMALACAVPSHGTFFAIIGFVSHTRPHRPQQSDHLKYGRSTTPARRKPTPKYHHHSEPRTQPGIQTRTRHPSGPRTPEHGSRHQRPTPRPIRPHIPALLIPNRYPTRSSTGLTASSSNCPSPAAAQAASQAARKPSIRLPSPSNRSTPSVHRACHPPQAPSRTSG
ncbi:ABC-2 type transporter [Nonomuraea jiangxiensis]|uniref:ABC-2 type transporter n=1 Tax=Nonomuraea jiangxiensis TaxID=633440 RepID=A0A1G9GYU9_9ACTN|nr:ABC-2 type transporter [Nonomuraea jiangxiensis]